MVPTSQLLDQLTAKALRRDDRRNGVVVCLQRLPDVKRFDLEARCCPCAHSLPRERAERLAQLLLGSLPGGVAETSAASGPIDAVALVDELAGTIAGPALVAGGPIAALALGEASSTSSPA